MLGCLAASLPSRSVPIAELQSALTAAPNAVEIHSAVSATIITSRIAVCGRLSRTKAIHSRAAASGLSPDQASRNSLDCGS
jgi:hypothetical protein